jgi:hypothetical protein
VLDWLLADAGAQHFPFFHRDCSQFCLHRKWGAPA